jgi:hypothetical protein
MKPATSGSATRKFCASASAAPSCAAMPRQLSATSISTNRITRRVCSSVSSRIVRASAWEKSPTSGGAGAVGAARAIASSSASARGMLSNERESVGDHECAIDVCAVREAAGGWRMFRQVLILRGRAG